MVRRRKAFRGLASAAASALALAGCADMVWQKPGADPTLTSRALRDCRQAAELNSFRLGFAPFSAAPNVIITPAGPGATFQPPGAVPYPDPLLAQDFTADCMHKKGFELVRRQ